MADFSSTPGVISAGGMNDLFLQRSRAGHDFDPPVGRPSVEFAGYGVTHGYFNTAGLKLLAGRLPTGGEFAGGAQVIVVSAKVAQAYWPEATAVGQTLTSRDRDYVVVGVVADGRYTMWEREPDGQIYQPLTSLAEARLSTVLVLLRPGIKLPEIAAAFGTMCPDCRVISA
jgi:hypothetical protein